MSCYCGDSDCPKCGSGEKTKRTFDGIFGEMTRRPQKKPFWTPTPGESNDVYFILDVTDGVLVKTVFVGIEAVKEAVKDYTKKTHRTYIAVKPIYGCKMDLIGLSFED